MRLFVQQPTLDTRAVICLFGEHVRRRRKARGWTQERLAEQAKLDRTYISGVERGVRNPTLLIAAAIAEALEVEVWELLIARESVESAGS